MRPLRPLFAVTCAALLGAAALGLGGCRGDDGAEVVAVVEETPITTAQLVEAYERLVIQAGLDLGDPRLQDDVLESLVTRQLVVQEAWDAGIRETDAYRAAEERLRRKLLVDVYTHRVLYDTLRVTEAELRQLFVRMNTVFEARHLFASSQAEAEALRRRLLYGETFDALAREVFADSALAASGGYLGEFGHDAMDPAFELAAFTTPVGQISQPVRTAQGWSVLRVENRASRPLLTESEFDTRRDRLQRYEQRRQRTEARFAHSRAVRDAVDPQFDAETLDRLAALAAGTGPVLDGAALESWYNQPLVRFSGTLGLQTWTVGQVETMAELAGEGQRAAVRDRAGLVEFIEGLIVREELVARAEARGLGRTDGFDAALADALAGWVFEQAQQRLRDAMAPPDDSLRAYFARHADHYLTPERVRVGEILVGTRREAAALQARLAAGADFDALARAHSLRPGAATAGGDLGFVDRDALGLLAIPVFEARSGDVVGPLEIAGRYALLRRGETVAPRPMTFAEARPFVLDDLELQYAQSRLREHVESLRARYRVEVRPEAVRRLFS